MDEKSRKFVFGDTSRVVQELPVEVVVPQWGDAEVYVNGNLAVRLITRDGSVIVWPGKNYIGRHTTHRGDGKAVHMDWEWYAKNPGKRPLPKE